MAEKATTTGNEPESSTSTAATASILGECVLKLTHSTTYEPPLYLFPELLPQVPQGTPPLPVWDAVADAVDIAASSWRIADATQLLTTGAAAAGKGGHRSNGSDVRPTAGSTPRPPQAMVTLTSMVAENRLLAAGLDATALRSGAFSSASIIEQLATLQARMGLTDEEGAAIMSNHFINLLAWQKLCEINGGAAGGHAVNSASPGSPSTSTAASSPSAASVPPPLAPSRKRARAAGGGGDDSSPTWLPSPDPWATNADLARGTTSGEKFIAAGEANVEERVDLLRTLAALYQRPWRSLASQGQQTDCVVPPGTVNVTSPYADSSRLPGATVDPAADLGWSLPGAQDNDSTASHYFGRLRVAHNPCFYSVVLSSRGASGLATPRRVPLMQTTTTVGRAAGAQPSAAVAAAALVPIDAGLDAYSSHPDVLSRYHFALVLRPVYDHKAALVSNGAIAPHGDDSADDNNNEDNLSEEGGEATSQRNFAIVHTKTPEYYTLWLVNYGRNGVRICGKGWVLGEPRELHAGDVLVIGDDVELQVELHTTAAAARATAVEEAGGAGATPTPGVSLSSSQVKRERAEDE